jgi:hypothetical protein
MLVLRGCWCKKVRFQGKVYQAGKFKLRTGAAISEALRSGDSGLLLTHGEVGTDPTTSDPDGKNPAALPQRSFVFDHDPDQFEVARTRKNLLPVAWLVKDMIPPTDSIVIVGSLEKAIVERFVENCTP